MKFNRKKFFDGVRSFLKLRRLTLTQKRVDALEFLLSGFETNHHWRTIPQIAYALATIAHETAWTFEPIKEYRNKPGSKGRKNQDRYWLSGYYGRGYVQLTWERNYKLFGIADNPDKALEPETAFRILTDGMHKGLFTSKRLSDYISDTGKDYKNARKIINGLDKAGLIASYANSFEEILRASKSSATASPVNASSAHIPQQPASKPQSEPPPTTTEVIVENIENVSTTPAPPPPSERPTKVTVERPSIWAKVGAGIAAITGIGINFGNLVTTRLNDMTLPQLGYVLGGVAIIGVALWLYDKAAKRAHEKTLAKMRTAADPAQTTVELREWVAK